VNPLTGGGASRGDGPQLRGFDDAPTKRPIEQALGSFRAIEALPAARTDVIDTSLRSLRCKIYDAIGQQQANGRSSTAINEYAA